MECDGIHYIHLSFNEQSIIFSMITVLGFIDPFSSFVQSVTSWDLPHHLDGQHVFIALNIFRASYKSVPYYVHVTCLFYLLFRIFWTLILRFSTCISNVIP